MSDISKDFYKNKRFYFTNAKTCEFVNSYKDFKEVIDNYNYNGLNITHKRSEPLDFLPFYFRNLVREFREEYKDHENLKRPTDIIIFTDSYSYSSTCGLIKGFQNTEGAIIVGYFGNPKIEGIDLFDGSQSISSIKQINDFYLYNKLYDLGFIVGQVTVGESFDDSVNDINPIPREYAFDPVDYRVNIYSSYSDDIYMDFIEEGKKIFNKFNNENYCNSKNDKLLLHIDSCKNIKGFEHAHGGYKCKKNQNRWDTSECQPYYCDIGYYFDQNKKQCVEECSFNGTKSYFIYEDLIEEKYDIDKNIFYTFTLINEKSNYYYFYKCSEDLVSGYAKIGFLNSATLFVNELKVAKENFKIEISSMETDFKFSNDKVKSFYQNYIRMFKQKLILILQIPKDHIFYVNNIFNFPQNIIKFAIYNDEMNTKDIIEGNNKYFSKYTDNFITLQKNKINIIYINYNNIEQIHYYIGQKNNY